MPPRRQSRRRAAALCGEGADHCGCQRRVDRIVRSKPAEEGIEGRAWNLSRIAKLMHSANKRPLLPAFLRPAPFAEFLLLSVRNTGAQRVPQGQLVSSSWLAPPLTAFGFGPGDVSLAGPPCPPGLRRKERRLIRRQAPVLELAVALEDRAIGLGGAPQDAALAIAVQDAVPDHVVLDGVEADEDPVGGVEVGPGVRDQ